MRELQARLAKSREKVEMLGERLGKVRGWVEGVERGDRELGGRVRMRLRVLAGLLVGVVLLVVLLHGWRFYIVGGGGGNGRLSGSGDLFGKGGVRGNGGVGGGGGGDLMRRRWNNMNLGALERRAIPQEKKVVGGGSISTTLTPSVRWQLARGKKGEDDGGGRMRKRWNNMNLGAAERAMSASSSGSSGSIQKSAPVTPSVEWKEVARGNDEDDEDPRLRVFDEL